MSSSTQQGEPAVVQGERFAGHRAGVTAVLGAGNYDAPLDTLHKMFFEHKALYPRKCGVPEGDYTIPFGEANLVREGEHVTVVAIGRMVNFAEKAIDALAKDGITCDLIDPRTLSPLDDETIYESLENTGRLVIVDESPPRCSLASDIAGMVASNAFHALKAPVVQVTPPHTPVPFARELERAYVPGPQKIEAASVRNPSPRTASAPARRVARMGSGRGGTSGHSG